MLPPTTSPTISGILILATLVTLMMLILMWVRLLIFCAGDEDSDMAEFDKDVDLVVDA